MSFLAPLFFAGAAAIALPILFHLIRRSTREKTPFSSLMFLTPSPPRVTRKSRLENLLLLALRCAVIALLAAAFARPFFRQAISSPTSGGRTVLLLDVSASMRREGLWQEAKSKAVELAKKAAAGEELAVVLFDRGARVVVTAAEWISTPSDQRAALVSQRLDSVQPGWSSTQLGHALTSAAELIDRDNGAPRACRIVVISDVQDGVRLEGLQGYTWPRNATVSIVPVKPKQPGNAGVQLLPEPIITAAGAEVIQARVSNSSDSKREQFTVRWASSATSTVSVYVPPGQSRAVELPKPAAADRVILSGDDADFDNAAWFVPPAREQIEVAFIGADGERDPHRQLFYLKRAFVDTPRQITRVVQALPNSALSISNAALIAIVDTPTDEQMRQLSERVKNGAIVLWPISSAAQADTLPKLIGVPLSATEAANTNYAMLAEIDFAHPLFAPFADTRFSDFTKIHFWKHRVLKFDSSPTARVLARFDDESPAVAQFTVGRGTVFVLASTWQPSDSQLALSSKFVPLLYSLLEFSGAIKAHALAFQIGDPVDLSGIADGKKLTVQLPDQSTIEVTNGAAFATTEQPGVYTAGSSRGKLEFAVNIAAEETKTAPLAIEELRKLGVPLGDSFVVSTASAARKAEQLQAAEIESRQKLWRWLLAATLVVLVAETFVALRAARRAVVAT
jgi:hypothetical protein